MSKWEKGEAINRNGTRGAALESQNDLYNERKRKVGEGTASTAERIHVAWCQLNGLHAPKDVLSGLELLQSTAEGGSGEACLRLADLYVEGELVERNCELANHWYLRAERSKDFYGPYGVAVAKYFGNECVDRNTAQAYQYFLTAAKRGHIPSKIRVLSYWRQGGFGLIRRALGFVQTIPIAVQAMFCVLNDDPNDRLWDGGRWLPDSPLFDRIRRNTRFE